MRNLNDVINQIVTVAPDLKPEFSSLQNSIRYSSPELMQLRWEQAAEILNDCATDHPKAAEIGDIFNGTG